MPRVRWCGATHSVLCLFVAIASLLLSFWIVSASADCWYDDEKHEEGAEVSTAEPCLNCTCSKGALVCYLRMCPRFPNPPPSGCFLLHKYQTCCSELICPELAGLTNTIEARSEPEDDFKFSIDKTIMKSACVSNGSIFGAGSAMDTSSSCEYCYCLAGKQACIKPKCLLSVEGCIPIFDPAYCCPIHYNCTSVSTSVTSTTTEQPQDKRAGCRVDGVYHPDGGKVLDIGHGVCDNCYCLKGLVRCQPLACAPPLLGCTPVIKPGECCAASYNCSGTIEIQPEPFYGHFPVISKEYAKLRKEVHRKRPAISQNSVTVSPLFLFDTAHSKQRSPGTFGTTRHFTGIADDASTSEAFLQHAITRGYPQKRVHTTLNPEFQNTKYKLTIAPGYSETSTGKYNLVTTPLHEEHHTRSSDYLDFLHGNIFNLLESQEDHQDSDIETTSKAATTTDNASETTTTDIPMTSTFTEDDPKVSTLTNSFDQTTELVPQTTPETTPIAANESSLNISYPITVKSVVRSTDCIQSKDQRLDVNEAQEKADSMILQAVVTEANELADGDDISITGVGDFSGTTTDHSAEVGSGRNFTSTTLKSVPESQQKVGVTPDKGKPKTADYDYDYSEPTLPPSLPNLRIIPFVAEDALDIKELSKEEMDYPQEREIDTDPSFGYHNHFSPPVKTEGGFIPKDPPILDHFYRDAAMSSSNFDEGKPNANCFANDGTEIIHGESVASETPCITCTCFYGNIACQKPNCPDPRPDCKKSTQDFHLCCPHYICDDEASRVDLDQLNETDSQTLVPERIEPPNAFRDVIKTEPAPNLPSLVIDMVPLSSEKNRSGKPEKEQTQTIVSQNPTEQTETVDELSLDRVLQLLLFPQEKVNETKPSETIPKETQTKSVEKTTVLTTPMYSTEEKPDFQIPSSQDDGKNLNQIDSNTGSALLINLAGCNIYGRMYRVGRIISELSGPCVECKCTEIGVHCEDLCVESTE